MLAKKPKGATKKRKSNSVSGLLWMFVGAVLTLMIAVFLYLSPLFNFTPSPNATTSDPNRQVQPRVNTDTDNSDYEFYDILPSQEMATIPDETIGELGSSQTNDIEFEPDVVVTQPDASTANTNANLEVSEGTTIEPNRDNNAVGNTDDEIVIVEENATYDGTPVTNSSESSGNNNANNNVNTAANKANNAGAAASATIEKAKPATTYILQINSFGNADEADRRRAQVLMAGVDAKVVKNAGSNGAVIYQVISRPMNNRQSVATAQQRLQNNGIDSIIVEQRR